MMRISGLCLAAVLGCAGAAQASDHLTDLDYLKANRCRGLVAGLGAGDTAGLDAMLKAESQSRSDVIFQRGAAEAARAKREASKADLKPRLSAELDGPCLAYLNAGRGMAASR